MLHDAQHSEDKVPSYTVYVPIYQRTLLSPKSPETAHHGCLPQGPGVIWRAAATLLCLIGHHERQNGPPCAADNASSRNSQSPGKLVALLRLGLLKAMIGIRRVSDAAQNAAMTLKGRSELTLNCEESINSWTP